jgi:hypothetical protein
MNILRQLAHKPVIALLPCLWLWVAVFGCLPANAQITFTASEMFAVIGEYSQEYISTNTNPSTMIGPTGGPQVWDFSQAPPQDYVRRLDIVLPTDGGHQASFPNATYAERYTDEVSIFQEWDYYNLPTNAGRIYYGTYDTNGGAVVWSPPGTDIPAIVGYGSNWSYNLTTTSIPPYTFNDTVTAGVDAYGTVVLPQIGQVQALRVNELTEEQELIDSFPVETYYIREYFWLVPGIGKVVDIVSDTSSTQPPANFTSAYEVRRVFEASPAGLQIQVQNGLAILNWLPATGVPGYQVQGIGDLSTTNRQILASPSSNSWSEAATAAQRFYHVFIEP